MEVQQQPAGSHPAHTTTMTPHMMLGEDDHQIGTSEVPRSNLSMQYAHQPCAWHELFSVGGKIPNRRAYHVSFVWNNEFYVHGGQDLKEGTFGDLWKINLNFIYNKDGTLEQDQELADGTEIEGASWQQVKIGGKYPHKLAHHQGVVQEHTREFIIYGGLKGLESSDSIYVVDLRNFNFTQILPAQTKEINGKALPGPRDDFCMITFQGEQARTKPVYLVGGFKNGQKMNDVYRLHQNGQQFQWELIEVPARSAPEPRSSYAACLATDTKLYIFGGSGDNNVKFNDIWEFDQNHWTCLSPNREIPDGTQVDQPLQKSGHQICLYKNRYVLVFGGIHEVTYEMNDLRLFDTRTKQWKIIDEENKNASESGSPKNKMMIQQTDSLKKNMFTIKNQNLEGSMNGTQASPSKKNSDTQNLGQTSPSNRFNNNPFLTIQTRSLSATKKAEATHQQESAKENEPGEELLTPTSISMKNAFIIKNADASFDQYYTMMKKRKSPHGSPSKLTGTGNIQFAPQQTQGHGMHHDQGSRIRIISDKQPPGRDGHSAYLHEGKWIVFGGDRHHMPFNDIYALDCSRLGLE